jgi:hypothetical protein
MRRWFAVLLAFLTLGSCAGVPYDDLPVGRFSGSLLVMWVGEGDGAGAGRFVFVPSPDAPLTFTRGGGPQVPVITPGMMYTDGGSIPRVAQVFKGFGPWGYAPAYMVHDWLFVARNCLRDGKGTEAHKALEAIGFPDSAAILGEAIRTLVDSGRVERNDLAGSVITGTVGGPISRAIWDRPGLCGSREISAEHRAEVERAFPGLSRARLRRALDAPDGFAAPVQGPRARVVAEISF